MQSGDIEELIANDKKLNYCDDDTIAELIGILLSVHKKRYLRCFTDEQRLQERNSLTHNYNVLLFDANRTTITPKLLISIFNFMICENLKTIEFREACVDLSSLISECKIEIIRNSMLIKMIRSIVRGSLYGEEPYDSILKMCIDSLTSNGDPDEINLMFLE